METELLGFPSLGARDPRLQVGLALVQASHKHPGPGALSLVLLLSQDGLTTKNKEGDENSFTAFRFAFS